MKKGFWLLVLPGILLCGCSSRFANQGDTVYLQHRNGPTLVVPPPLSKTNISYFYILPEQNSDSRVSIFPPD